MRKALVTGANGFIGSALVRELLAHGIEVIAVVRKNRNHIPENVRGIECDLANFCRLPEMISDRDIDVVYHMAWSGSSGTLRSDYSLQLENAKYTCDMVKIADAMQIRRFVGAGTLAQIDCDSYISQNGSIPNPVSCYGSAKIAAQYMSKSVANSIGLDHVWCFISNTYGVGNAAMNFVDMAIQRMLKGERSAFTDGEQNYDLVYVSDTICGLYLCGKYGKNNHSYYIGSGEPRKLKEYIKIIRDAVNPDIPIYFGEIPFRGVTLPLEKYNIETISRDTGYNPKIKFEDGIIKTVQWLREKNL